MATAESVYTSINIFTHNLTMVVHIVHTDFLCLLTLDLVPPSPYQDNSSHLGHCLNATCQTIVWEWSPVRGVLGARENTPRKQDLWPQFLWNTKLFLVCVFMFLLTVVSMTEFFFQLTHYYLLLFFKWMFMSFSNVTLCHILHALMSVDSLNSRELHSGDLS